MLTIISNFEYICNRFAGPNANLSDVCLSSICIATYLAFLRYNELASLRCRDIRP